MIKNWAHNEFENIDLGDQRLNNRLIKLSKDLSASPESPINQSSENWAASKAAYRFFQNESVDYKEIVSSHSKATLKRSEEYSTVLAIQDTTYLTYSHHAKTDGLCILTKSKGKNKDAIYTCGLAMHSTLVVSTEGLPLGIVDQKIYSRPEEPPEQKELKKRSHNNAIPIEKKDSYRWIESLQKTHEAFETISTIPITVCDRESDIFDFFFLAQKLESKVLVRAKHNRMVNKSTPYSKKTGEELWSFMEKAEIKGSIEVKIPAQKNQPERLAQCRVKIGRMTLTPPRAHSSNMNLDKISLNAIYISEDSNLENKSPIDWILLTNIPVETFDQALEKISWYCLRWRIEIFHKVLKSGMRAEDCRLQTADRLIRYLSVISIVAWRIFWLTMISRVSAETSCRIFLNEDEWKILYRKFNKKESIPENPPSINKCVRWIAMLGGFLGRKNDEEPGNTHIWRGLKKFSNILEGMMLMKDICG